MGSLQIIPDSEGGDVLSSSTCTNRWLILVPEAEVSWLPSELIRRLPVIHPPWGPSLADWLQTGDNQCYRSHLELSTGQTSPSSWIIESPRILPLPGQQDPSWHQSAQERPAVRGQGRKNMLRSRGGLPTLQKKLKRNPSPTIAFFEWTASFCHSSLLTHFRFDFITGTFA